MNRVNNWLSVGANIGIIIGLVILIVEVRQNNDIARVQFFLDNFASMEAIEHTISGESASEAWAKAVEAPESLSTSEIRVLDSVLANVLSSIRRVHLLAREGYIPEHRVLAVMEIDARAYFSNRFARAWWNKERGLWDQEFVELFDVALEKGSASTDARWVEQIREEVAKPPAT